MTNETLEKGNELTEQINEVKNTIHKLSYRKSNSVESHRALPRLRDRKWMLRLFNQDDRGISGDKRGPAFMIFDNLSNYGSDILLQEEDSELLDIIIEYYNNKLNKLEEELASL